MDEYLHFVFLTGVSKFSKVNIFSGVNSALEQIQKRDYAEKYREKTGGRLFELGLIFSQAKRNLVRFDFMELREDRPVMFKGHTYNIA